jgi:TPR repeat protein
LASEHFKLASAQNRVLSQINYGTCLFHGQSIPIDFALAVKYFKLAADQNQPDGLYRYGHCLQAGKGVHVDFTAAVKFYQLSADPNRPDGQCHYGGFKGVIVHLGDRSCPCRAGSRLLNRYRSRKKAVRLAMADPKGHEGKFSDHIAFVYARSANYCEASAGVWYLKHTAHSLILKRYGTIAYDIWSIWLTVV